MVPPSLARSKTSRYLLVCAIISLEIEEDMDKDIDWRTQIFYSETHGPVSAEKIMDLISRYLDEDSNSDYTLVIGTDSHEKGKMTAKSRSINLVTAIIIHRHGHGGKYFWQRKHIKNIHTLREKIYTETFASLNFASSFVPNLQKKLNGNSPKLEIHIDVGERGETRNMIKEVVGMVTGNGFVAKTKPFAYGASYVADKHT